MKRPDMGCVYLLGLDSDTWSEPDKSDLIALQARHADDMFTAWITDSAVHWWHSVAGKYLRASKSKNPYFSCQVFIKAGARVQRTLHEYSVLFAGRSVSSDIPRRPRARIFPPYSRNCCLVRDQV